MIARWAASSRSRAHLAGPDRSQPIDPALYRLARDRHDDRRSAYAQLRYNPLLLVMTVLGLGLVFLAPWGWP
jgi:hypothetical protein